MTTATKKHVWHCKHCETNAARRFGPDCPFTVCVHEERMGGPYWWCDHCHDEPPVGHICPHCDRVAGR